MNSTQTMSSTARASNVLPFIVVTLAACFYLYEFILQVSPSVMTNGLMRDFNVGAAGLGFISASYFYAYMPMQLPAGMLYDRFGPRILLTFAILVCVLGTFIFATTDSRFIAGVGRFCMGVGSAFSFIGTLVLISRWFEARYYAVLVGIAQTLSSVGAVTGEVPLSKLVDHYGWRPSLLGIGCVGVVLASAVWLIVRDYPEGAERHEVRPGTGQELAKLKDVCARSQTWLIAVYAFLVWAPIAVFAALWGVPFIMNVYHTSLLEASSAISMIWIGIGVGSPAFGWWSDYLGKRKLPLYSSALLGLVSLATVLYIPNLSMTTLFICLFILGLGASGQAVSFAVVKDINRPDQVGTATGLNNMATVAGGALIQPLVGVFLHLCWQGQMQNGVPFYDAIAYEKSLAILPACYILAFIISKYLIAETNCRSSY